MTKEPKPRTQKEIVADVEKVAPLVNECMEKIHGYLHKEKSNLWEQTDLFTDIMAIFLLVHFKSLELDQSIKKEDCPQATDEYCKIIALKTKGLLKGYDKAASEGSMKIH